MALVALQFNHVTKACLESLHDSYVMQLQSFGLWHWSIFVIMHIEDEQRRESYVKLYLSKHVTGQSELNEKETFLVEKLGVPVDWIYEFKALRAKYECNYENQFKLLLKAHKWNEAHGILVDILAPEFFIKENFKTLNQYLVMLAKEHQSINKWNLGGLIYLDFIRLNQKAELMFKFEADSETEAQVAIFSFLIHLIVSF
jgi:nuclear pore complex protein Nup98-Nup96